MNEVVVSSPLAYRGGAWYTKEAFKRASLSFPHSVLIAFYSWYLVLQNPTCFVGDIAGFGGAFGVGVGLFLSSYKWFGRTKEPFINFSLLRFSLKLVLLGLVFFGVAFLTKNSSLTYGGAFLYGFTIWFAYVSLVTWGANKLVYVRKKE